MGETFDSIGCFVVVVVVFIQLIMRFVGFMMADILRTEYVLSSDKIDQIVKRSDTWSKT